MLFVSCALPLAACGGADSSTEPSAGDRADAAFASCLQDAEFVAEDAAADDELPPLPLYAYRDPFADDLDDVGTWVKVGDSKTADSLSSQDGALVYAATSIEDAERIREVALAASVQAAVDDTIGKNSELTGGVSDAPAVVSSGRAIFVGDRALFESAIACGEELS